MQQAALFDGLRFDLLSGVDEFRPYVRRHPGHPPLAQAGLLPEHAGGIAAIRAAIIAFGLKWDYGHRLGA
jgi:hypothetical protein